MQSVFSVTMPFFGLVLAGYIAAARGWLPTESVPALNAFVLFFALPCLLFRFGASLPIATLLDPRLLAIYFVCALVVVGFTIAVTLSRAINLKDAGFGALVAAFPNSGFMGVPLIAAMLGPSSAGPVVTTMLVDLFVTSSLCIAVAQSHRDPSHPADGGAAAAAGRALRGALGNPFPWAVALGASSSAVGITLWGPLDTLVRMLGDAATPVALFTIGTVLWRANQQAHTRTPMRHVLPVALIKLLLHPLLVFLLAAGAGQLGFGLTTQQLVVATLTAALPSASSVSMLAERYGADSGRIARIILLSTALSFLTFSLLAWAFSLRS